MAWRRTYSVLLLVLLTAVEAFAPVAIIPRHVLQLQARQESTADNDDDDNDMSELFRRIQSVKNADKLQASFTGSETLQLPVVAFDALLPNQRLVGTTTDSTFGRFLRHVGIGGIFCMVSINHSKRLLRRNGVVARIEIVDAKQSSHSDFAPTAVDFVIVGVRHCRLVGPGQQMTARVGRWRRAYDPDGEESSLGWGSERFVDASEKAISVNSNVNHTQQEETTGRLHPTEWSINEVDCNLADPDNNRNQTLLQRTKSILPLIETWKYLASNAETYENTNVVATARLATGMPGLRVDPAALIRNVLVHLGDSPQDPKDFAFWGAALINPLPVALGVAPEIRGQMLEAPTTQRRLDILEWGIRRSIENLQGTVPLI